MRAILPRAAALCLAGIALSVPVAAQQTEPAQPTPAEAPATEQTQQEQPAPAEAPAQQTQQEQLAPAEAPAAQPAPAEAPAAQPTQADAAEAPAAQPGAPNRVLKETHGAWEIHCLEGTDTCVMQHVGMTADGRRAMLVMVERLAGVTAEGKDVPAALTVHAPLGVLIPYGVRVKVDQGEVQPVQLMRCLTESCMARAPLTEPDVQLFKRGTTARFGFFLTDEVLVDVSLTGFTAAYNSLKPLQVQAAGQ